MPSKEYTTMRIKRTTAKRLHDLKIVPGEEYNVVIERLLGAINEKELIQKIADTIVERYQKKT